MISRAALSRVGIAPDKVAERAVQLLKEGCPTYSAAWYQAYDELLPTSLSAAAVSAALTAASVREPVSVSTTTQPQLARPGALTADEILASLRASEEKARPAKRSAPNSIEEVLTADELDFDALSAYLSVRAVMAYGEKHEIEDELTREQGCTNFKYFEEGPTAAFGYVLRKHALVAFRGTRVPEKTMTRSQKIAIVWSDWIRTDLNCIPWYRPMRHLGFARAWNRIRAQVIDWLRSLPDDSRVVLTGHSLGGALAVVAAFDLVEHFPIRAVVTFGAPRVGLPLFRRAYHMQRCGTKTLHAVTRRYTHQTDLVSRVPPPVLYCHVGDESVVYPSGVIQKGTPVNRIVRFEEWLESSSLKQTAKPGLITMPPAPTPHLSRAQRTAFAWSKFVQKLKVLVPLVTHDSSRQLLWLLCSAVGILSCAAVVQDGRRHSSVKYVKAYEKKFPQLARQTKHMSALLTRMLEADPAKFTGSWDEALKKRPSPRN